MRAQMKIKLTQGQETIIDSEDFDIVSQHTWCAHFQPNRANGGGFTAVSNLNGKTLLMHRIILGAKAGGMIDHIDGDSLNNRKNNLRFANHSQNAMNQQFLRKDNTSGCKGVYRDKSRNKYVACIKINGKSVFLGRFTTSVEAAEKYNLAAKRLHGEFAVLNKTGE